MKTVLITGGSRGIGAAAVKAFAERGYSVICNYNNSEKEAEDLVCGLVNKGFDVRKYKCDVSDVTAVEQMFLYVEKYFKKLDVLVNNAGVALYSQIQDVTERDYDRVMSVNCKGVFFASACAVKLFLKRGKGSIVNMSSVWGLNGASCESVYSMSKYAVVGLTKSLDAELSDCGICVNCVCPPIVDTSMCKGLSQSDKEEFNLRFGAKVLSADEVAAQIITAAESGESGGIYDFAEEEN